MRFPRDWPILAAIVAAVCLAPAAAAADQGAALVLPARVVVGQPATLAVLDAQGKLAPGAQVEFSGGATLTTDETGRAVFTAPTEPGVITVRLPGGASATTTAVRMLEHPAGELITDDVPSMVTLGTPFRLGGTGFRGEADANVVALSGKPAVVLAASPLELMVTAGLAAEPGNSELTVTVGEQRTEPTTLTLVALEVSADKPSLAPRKKGKLTVRVRGTGLKLEIEARNQTPEIVRMRNGNVQRLTTKGGEQNIATIELEGRREGDYSISARLVPRPRGLPDTAGAMRHLIRAMRLAPNEEMLRLLQRQIHRVERHPQDSNRVRDELERLLSTHPEGEFGKALEAAWKALLSR